MVHTCRPSTRETRAGGVRAGGQLGVREETLCRTAARAMLSLHGKLLVNWNFWRKYAFCPLLCIPQEWFPISNFKKLKDKYFMTWQLRDTECLYTVLSEHRHDGWYLTVSMFPGDSLVFGTVYSKNHSALNIYSWVPYRRSLLTLGILSMS